MIIKYFKNDKEVIKHNVIRVRQGYTHLAYQFKNGQHIEVDDVRTCCIEDEQQAKPEVSHE